MRLCSRLHPLQSPPLKFPNHLLERSRHYLPVVTHSLPAVRAAALLPWSPEGLRLVRLLPLKVLTRQNASTAGSTDILLWRQRGKELARVCRAELWGIQWVWTSSWSTLSGGSGLHRMLTRTPNKGRTLGKGCSNHQTKPETKKKRKKIT